MLETHFQSFRDNVIGRNHVFPTPFGMQKLIYADWTASARAYAPIEHTILEEIAPFIGNTHTETTITGTCMTQAYKQAKAIIKHHVNANETDVLLFCGSGMTGAVNKLQRILGLRIPERVGRYIDLAPAVEETTTGNMSSVVHFRENARPVVFITHMEHHSNHTSWLETLADVEIIAPTADGLPDLQHLELLLHRYAARQLKIASVTACSNVTGIQTPYHDIAALMHKHGGYCFVDFACSGPYVHIDMHPIVEDSHLDAIYLSPHKFLGGPGTPGILIFNRELYSNTIPDHPGGGTVLYTNPWKVHTYLHDIEEREDGGTPPFLQAIRAAMAVRLKEKMGVEAMLQREDELLERVFEHFDKLDKLVVLAGQHRHRLGIISFYIKGLHYHLAVKLLNDRFGIQVRGGCACAGTYGHYLLHVEKEQSEAIYSELLNGDHSNKPGWVRLSLHPVMSNDEVEYILHAIEKLHNNYEQWAQDYAYNPHNNDFHYKKNTTQSIDTEVQQWFTQCVE